MIRRAGALAAAWLVTAGGSASARNEVIPLESPAYFVEASGGYAYREVAERTSRIEGQTLTIFGETWRDWFAGGSVTVPVAAGFGVRGRVSGGGTEVSIFGAGTDLSGIAGGGDVFWRDPTRGQLGVGYAYERRSVDPGVPVDSIRSHGVPVFASLYMPDLEGGTVDWNVGFEYRWLEVRTPVGSRDQWAYEVFVSSTWYVNRFVSFEGGAEYARQLSPTQSDRVEGVFALELLVPGGTRHYGAVELSGRIGRDELKALGPFGDENRLTWQVGAQVSVHFPGVTSLVERNRACR